MNWEAIGAVGEILGAIGVIATLGYLAIQIRHGTKATRMATAQQMTDRWVSINLHMANNPKMIIRDFGPQLDEEGRQAALAFWRAIFHQWSNNHYQHSRGALDDILFRPTSQEIARYASDRRAGPNMRVAWHANRFIYNEEFGRFMDELLAENSPGSRVTGAA